MSRYLVSVLGGVLLLAPIYQTQAAGEVDISTLSRFLMTDGRGVVTLSFTVRNSTNANQRLREHLIMPDGWASLSTLAPFVLPVGGQETRLIHISVPRKVAAGVFPVKYFIRGVIDSNVYGQEQVDVKVAAISGSELSHLGLPGMLLPGEHYDVDFKVENTGNTKKRYNFRVRDGDGYVKSVTPRSVVLPPGAVSRVKIKGTIPSRVMKKNHHITLVANAGSESSESAISIPVVSRIPVGLGKYHKLKGNLSSIYRVDDDESIWGLNYRASGFLDAKGKHYIMLDARASEASDSNASIYGDKDYYQLKYKNKYWDSTLGHQSFYMNQLVGHGLSGLGAEVKYNVRNNSNQRTLSVRAFNGKTRSDAATDQRISGVEANYNFNHRFEVGLSLLKHEEEGITHDVKGIEGVWRSKYSTLKAGYARDNNDDARSIDFYTNWKQLGFNLSHRQGGAEYSGGYSDRRDNQAGISWRHNKNSVLLTMSEGRNNLDKNPETQSLNTSRKSIKATRVFGEKNNMVFSVGYRTSEEIDTRESSLKTIDRSIDAAFLEYKHDFINFDISAKWEYGDRDDRIDESGSGSRHELALDWRKSDDLDLRLTYSKNNDLNFSGNGENFGISGRYKINGRQSISSYWQNSDSETSSSDSFGLSYTHRFFNRHQVGFDASYIDSTDGNGVIDKDKRFTLSYTLPLDLPLRRRRDVGSVKGRAVYGNTGQPAKSLVLQLGSHYAVTDDDGRFYYPDILAKDHILQIDTSRGAVGNYVLNNSGAEVTVGVESNKVKVMNITLEAGSSLTGRIRTFEIDKAAAIQNQEGVTEASGLAGILVQLKPVSSHLNQNNLQRVLTDGDGEFSFLGVPPGQWQVMVVDKLPDTYRLVQKSQMVNLKAEETTEILFKALPRVLTIERTGPVGGFSVSG